MMLFLTNKFIYILSLFYFSLALSAETLILSDELPVFLLAPMSPLTRNPDAPPEPAPFEQEIRALAAEILTQEPYATSTDAFMDLFLLNESPMNLNDRQRRILQEMIVVRYQDISFLLIPDVLQAPEGHIRNIPYYIFGLIDKSNTVYRASPDQNRYLQKLLSQMDKTELQFERILIDPENNRFLTLIQRYTNIRDRIYCSHDSQLIEEICQIINSEELGEKEIAIVDVGMGKGGFLKHCLAALADLPVVVSYYGCEPNDFLRRHIPQNLTAQVQISPMAGEEELSHACFIQHPEFKRAHKIAILQGVTTLQVIKPSKSIAILRELLELGFDNILITGNTPVNLDSSFLVPLLRAYGYILERTLYPDRLFTKNNVCY